jgi:branched-chain amino acid transport system ATP-binding protein
VYFAVRDLSVKRGPIEVLQDVGLEVERGEIVSIIGSNGAGKTTLLLTIVGMLKPEAGVVELGGISLAGLTPDRVLQAGIALCPAERHLFSRMTVLENLMLGAFARRAKAEIGRDLEQVFTYFPRLGERRSQRSGTLSGGEQQMLAMGRAVMGRPQMLLLDEPSLGLAPVAIEELGRLIQHINRDGTTILLVEQNAMLALEISQRAYVMELGRFVLQGSSRELARQDEVRRAFLGE